MARYEAPALANEMDMARPKPLEAPLMKTALPERSCLVGSMAGYVSLCTVLVVE